MKGLKKIAAFLLTVSLILTALPTALAEEGQGAVISAEDYAETVDCLSALGVYGFAEEKAESTVTRGMFAKIVTDLVGVEGFGNAEQYFTDVAMGHKYFSEIGTVASLGLMNGKGDGIFAPEEAITYTQAVKTLVSLLGYSPVAGLAGGYVGGYLRYAYEIGLLENPPYDYNAPLSFDVAADLVRLSLDVEVYEIISVKDGGVYFASTEDETLLKVYHGIGKEEGRMTDNGITALNRATQTLPGYCVIDGHRLSGVGEKERGFLGYYVEYYYREDDDELLYLCKTKRKNEDVTVKASDITPNASDFSKTCLVTEQEGREEKYDIDVNADLIYNGVLDETFTSNSLKIKDGTLTLIDTDRDGDYDLVIAEEYVDVVVLKCNTNTQILSAKYAPDGYGQIRWNEYETAVFENAEGAETDPSKIAENTVLSVFKSKNKEKIRFVASTLAADITVESVETDGDDWEMSAQETVYCFSASYITLMKNNPSVYKKPEAGATYNALFNYEGNIAMLTESQGTLQYAYLMAAGNVGSGLRSETVSVKLHLESDHTAVVPTAKKLTLNGDSTKTGDDILKLSELYNKMTGAFQPQLVMVRINAAGELKELKTATDATSSMFGFDLEHFSLDFVSTLGYSPRSINGVLTYNGAQNINADTKIFVVRNSTTAVETSDEEEIKVIDYKTARGRYGSCFCKFYDADESWTCAAAVLSEPLDYSSRLFVVSDTFVRLNDKGEKVQSLSGWWGQDIRSFTEAREGVFSNAVLKRYPNTDGKVRKGDAFEVTFDVEENIIGARLIYSPARDTDPDYCFFDMNGNSAMDDDNTMYILGYPCYISNDRIGTYSKENKKYTTVLGTDGKTEEKYWTTFLTGESAIQVCEYDCKTGKVRKADVSAIPSVAQLTGDGYSNIETDTKVLVKRVDGVTYDVLVVTNVGKNR